MGPFHLHVRITQSLHGTKVRRERRHPSKGGSIKYTSYARSRFRVTLLLVFDICGRMLCENWLVSVLRDLESQNGLYDDASAQSIKRR